MSAVHDKTHKLRQNILNHTRDLARSGQYADCATIQAALQATEGFDTARRRFADRSFRASLDRLCTLAREKRGIARSGARVRRVASGKRT